MVYLRAVTPALCEVLDAAALPQTAADVRNFIEQRLRILVHSQVPSQLDNALWIYLTAQEQLLLRLETTEKESPEAAYVTLPPSLQLPASIHTVQDAVRWYCGELNVNTAAAAEAEGGVHVSTSSPSRSSAPAATAKPSLLRRSTPLRPHNANRNGGARIDELMRHRHQPTTSTTATATTAVKKKEVQRTRPSTGPIATLRLALEALSNPKRAAALRQPRSLALVVRSLVSLWSVVYLCRQLRQHQLYKEQMLRGGELAPSAATTALAVCFHDYDVLLPWDLMHTVLSRASSAEERVSITMAAVSARCRAVEAAREHSSSLPDVRAPVALVINPAVTLVDDNPDRLRKNARVDAIDEAANKYYYTLLATRAHGQAESALRSTTAANASASSSAAAAAHQEAVRSSLATVDLGDYGVLDPSRMRAPVPLTSASAAGVSSSASSMHAERNAKSYALFLRDASIGFDIQIMALTGAGVGYYIGYLRGRSTEWCTLYAVVGLVTMMLVDAVLVMVRMGRQDAAALRSRKRIQRQREKLEKEGEKLVQAMRRAATEEEAATTPDAAVAKTAAAAAAAVAPPTSTDSVDVDDYTKKRQ